MKTVLLKILLLIALLTIAETAVYSEEKDNNQVVNDMAVEYDYNNAVAQKKPNIQTSAERVMLIKANVQYVQITAILYAFSLIIIIIFMWDKKHQAKDIVTMVGMASVIFGTLLLVLMVGDTQQLTAPMGILGAIAGYLFGSSKKTDEPGES